MSFLSVESVVPSVPWVVPSLRSELFWSGNTHFYIRPAATSTVPSASAVAVCQAPSFEERCRDETARTQFTSSYPLMVDAAWLHTTVTQIQAALGQATWVECADAHNAVIAIAPTLPKPRNHAESVICNLCYSTSRGTRGRIFTDVFTVAVNWRRAGSSLQRSSNDGGWEARLILEKSWSPGPTHSSPL